MPSSLKTVQVGGVTLHLSTPDATEQEWIGQDAILRQLLACWLVLTPVVIWVFRYVAPGHPRWLACVLVGSFTAANLSGFLHGFVLFCSLPLDLGVPFGGFTEIGGMVAVGLWLYLFHVIVLAGYAATLSFSTYLISRDQRVEPLEPASPSEEHRASVLEEHTPSA